MDRELQKRVNRYTNARKTRKKWLSVVISLCVVVAIGTSYLLINPAATQQQKTYCGLKEHIEHTEDCYGKVLVCQLSEKGHTHSDSCYTTKEYLSCELKETDGHKHGEDCYETVRDLICNDTNEEHEHTDECYEEKQVLVCQLEECEPHHHGSGCYETQTECTCGKEECKPHKHSEACYEMDYDHPQCKLPIHRHTLQCFSNPEADVETASVWEHSFDKVELTGNWHKDVIDLAETQLGYTESTANYEVQEDGTTMKGYTRYGDWYGDPYGDWCAMFCSFCLNYAGVDKKLMPRDANCQHWIKTLSKKKYKLYRSAHNEKSEEKNGEKSTNKKEKYVPRPGDLVFFDWDSFDPEHLEQRSADHIGFVSELIYDETKDEVRKIVTIEGNSSDSVAYNSYDFDDSRILGYGMVPDNPDLNDKFELTAYTEDGIGVKVTGLSGALPYPPEEITLTVKKVSSTNTVEQLSQAAEADGLSCEESYLFDISLWHDGKLIEPTGNVTVTFLNICSEGDNASVYHVDPEAGVTTNMDAVTKNGNAVIDTDHFSLYGVLVNSASGKNVTGTGSIDWDSTATPPSITSFNVTASSSDMDNAYFYVQYSDDGTSWTSGIGPSAKTGKGKERKLHWMRLL